MLVKAVYDTKRFEILVKKLNFLIVNQDDSECSNTQNVEN